MRQTAHLTKFTGWCFRTPLPGHTLSTSQSLPLRTRLTEKSSVRQTVFWHAEYTSQPAQPMKHTLEGHLPENIINERFSWVPAPTEQLQTIGQGSKPLICILFTKSKYPYSSRTRLFELSWMLIEYHSNCLVTMPPEGGMRAEILPGYSGIDRSSRDTGAVFEPLCRAQGLLLRQIHSFANQFVSHEILN
ncbi:hypothetical protein T265_00581 [Opisthorchis viverrini]|uniref:Uncharacterized protein n=1 Tax=Opisthorchis viverrini TaxID=6198 RepID=A0A075A159_OPIVI|nr:hypothetical protein T265_00581 [Opisthorchis viverrini]KER33463.1 hypothetical protein T265_00581 [Opisthorchis viverrini]